MVKCAEDSYGYTYVYAYKKIRDGPQFFNPSQLRKALETPHHIKISSLAAKSSIFQQFHAIIYSVMINYVRKE